MRKKPRLRMDYYTPRFASPAIDKSKAFDMVEWKSLFEELDKRGVSPVIIIQGAITSPIFYCVYCDEMRQADCRSKCLVSPDKSELFSLVLHTCL